MRKFLALFASLFIGIAAHAAIPFGSSDSSLVPIPDTNSVVVYSVGITAYRGTYTYKTTLGDGFAYYTNSAGVTIQYDAGNLDFYFSLTNGAGVQQYASSGSLLNQPEILPQTFLHQNGAATPDGVITWGTNYVRVTNTTSVLYGNVWYVGTNGSDIYAQKGNPAQPAASLYRVLTNLSVGDIVYIGPGHYTNDFGADASQKPNFQFPNNLVIQGAGVGITYIDGRFNSSTWHLGSSNTISDFTATNLWIYDGTLLVNTNTRIHDIEASATGDVIVFQTGTLNASLWNLQLGGNSDKIADLTATAGYLTNSIININNVRLVGGGGAGGNGLNFGSGNGGNGVMQARGGGIHVQVTGLTAEQHVVTNFPNTFVFAPLVQRTNLVSGTLYTNNYSVPINVEVGVSNILAAVNGTAKIAYWVYQQGGAASLSGETNEWGSGTTGSTVAVTNLNGTLNFQVPVGFVYTVTNQSVGSGNAAGTRGGRINIP